MTQIITVTSGKGGVGKSTTSASIATGLAQRGHRVCAIDMDAGLKNLDLILGLERRTVYDMGNVLHLECSLTQALVKDKKTPNLYLLPASQTRDKDTLSLEGVKTIFDGLKKEGFDFIILDSPAGIESAAQIAMYYADLAIIVANPEVSSVRDADKMIGILQSKSLRAKEGGEPMKEHLLITRYSPERVAAGEMLSMEDVCELLMTPLLGVIPESPDVLSSSNQGIPVILDEKSRAGQAYQDAAARLLGEEVAHRFISTEKKGFLKRLLGRVA